MAFYGCIADSPDNRDHKFKLAAPDQLVLTEAHDLTPMFPPVMDQGQYSSCTVHSVTAAWRYARLNTDQPDIELSRAMLYWQSGVIENNTGDVGRQIRDVVSALATTGVCRESLWDYSKIGQEPPPEAYADAANQKALEYMRVDVDRRAINEAIFMGYPCIVGFNVYPEFESDEVAATGIVPMPKAGSTPIGAHSVLIGAYDPAFDTFLNSWGDFYWGLPDKKGYGKLPRGYLEQEGRDFWALLIDKGPSS